MRKTWKDPDTGVVHAIQTEESPKPAWEHAHAMPSLLKLPVDAVAQRFFRRVTLSCGEFIQLDSDEFISPKGEAVLRVPPPILRPWITGREAPTCVICAIAKPSAPM